MMSFEIRKIYRFITGKQIKKTKFISYLKSYWSFPKERKKMSDLFDKLLIKIIFHLFMWFTFPL